MNDDVAESTVERSISASSKAQWADVIALDELQRARKTVFEHEGDDIVVFWHEEQAYALANTCVHKQNKLNKGMIMFGCIVCPGHQWKFDLATGYCEIRDRYQPTYPVRIDSGRVLVQVGGGGG